MKRNVVAEVGVGHGETLGAEGRVDRLHGPVEAEDEIVEVEAESQAVGDGKFLIEAAETENPTGLGVVAADGPDVSCVDEERPIQLPEQFRAPLGAQA